MGENLMAKVWQFQSNMNRGELDPLLVGRIDLQSYYNGVKTGTNVLGMPQGGLKKRPGMQFLDETLGNGRLENFSFNIEQNYVLAFSNLRMEIYKDGVLQTNINGSGNDYLVTPWTTAQIADFDYIQSADTIIITHQSVQTRSITRTSDTTWTITTLTFSNIPQHDFNDGSSPTPVSEVQDLAFTNTTENDRYKLSLEGLLTDEIVFANDDTTNEESIRVALQNLVNTGNSGVSVSTQSGFSGGAATYRVTFANEAAEPWQLVTATPIFTANAAFRVATTRIATGTSRKEDTWSAGRGWPRTCTFHEGRLWFGGSTQRPATMWGSRVFDFFNFEIGTGRDDEAVEATLDTDQVNAIEAIFSNRALQVFTSGGEFYVPESPITPSNVAVRPQTKFGSLRVRPVTIDAVTIFAQRTGKALLEFLFVDDQQANQSRSISVLAAHLINTPVQMSVSRGTSASDANYVYIVNNDGSMTVFNTLASQDVSGFTSWSTTGNIKSVAVSDNLVYLLVERTIDGSTVYQLERENTSFQTDSTVTDTTNDDEITGLDHLEGETVWAKADGAFMGSFTVASGKITLQRTSSDKEAGIQFVPLIRTLPLNVSMQNGPNASKKKRIIRASLHLFESNGVIVGGTRIPDKTIGVDQFDAPSPMTGIERRHISLGWQLEADITITQNTPMQFTILNIGLEVAI
jgi:hypothetical protein